MLSKFLTTKRRIAVALFLVGAVGAFVSYTERKIAGRARLEPQPLSAAGLIANGPGDNYHVRLTDFVAFTPGRFDYERRSRRSRKRSVFFPAIPKTASIPTELDSIELILEFDDPDSQAEVEQALAADAVDGLIVNGVKRLPPDVRTGLASTCGVPEPTNAWRLEVGRTPKDATLMLGILIASVLGIGAAAFLFATGGKRTQDEE